MFSGIIEEIGIVESITPTPEGRRIAIACRSIAASAKPGESVAVSGVCLTVVGCAAAGPRFSSGLISADVLDRTWGVTNLHALAPRARVNLERALRAGDRIGGHFVLGHVDGQGVVRSRRRAGGDVVLGVAPEAPLLRGIVQGGSIAVDGVSLTVARVDSGVFYAHLIPFTLNGTTLGGMQAGGAVNLELDMLGRHLCANRQSGITEEFLHSKGF